MATKTAKRPLVSPKQRPTARARDDSSLLTGSSGAGGPSQPPLAAGGQSLSPLVFLCYCREDGVWMELLLTVLKFIELKGFIRIFHDKRSIELGDAWRQSVEKGIQEASIVICLLSPQYFASEFVMSQELPLIQKRQKDGSLK